MSSEDQDTFLSMINSVSKYKYKLDDTGNLVRDGNKTNGFFGLGRSETFSKDLDAGIAAEATISITFGEVYLNQNDKIVSVSEYAGGGVAIVRPSRNRVDVTISGKGGII